MYASDFGPVLGVFNNRPASRNEVKCAGSPESVLAPSNWRAIDVLTMKFESEVLTVNFELVIKCTFHLDIDLCIIRTVNIFMTKLLNEYTTEYILSQ